MGMDAFGLVHAYVLPNLGYPLHEPQDILSNETNGRADYGIG
jgi:hypothetical protein